MCPLFFYVHYVILKNFSSATPPPHPPSPYTPPSSSPRSLYSPALLSSFFLQSLRVSRVKSSLHIRYNIPAHIPGVYTTISVAILFPESGFFQVYTGSHSVVVACRAIIVALKRIAGSVPLRFL